MRSYDVAIIGAGIGGLVSGCYLAKHGLSVFLAERHHLPGGYCSSFKRNGILFNAAAHSFGGCRDNGIMKKIFNDLELEGTLNIKRLNPTDIIITPDYEISFWADINRTISECGLLFPNEHKNIEKFFDFLLNPDYKTFTNFRTWTFKKLMDIFFRDERLKSLLSFPVFGNGGLPPSRMSAFLGSKIFLETLLDGGYYPEEGMQSLAASLADRFVSYGGSLHLSCPVKEIMAKDNRTEGLKLENNEVITSKYVISNSDARHTFLKLLGNNSVDKDFSNNLKKMTPSLSMFILYLGINKNYLKSYISGTNVWYLSDYNLDKAFELANKGDIKSMRRYMVHISPNHNNVIGFINAPYKNKSFWTSNKSQISEYFLKIIEKDILPELSEHIVYKDAATPPTLERYTLNYKGSAYGWAGTVSQFADVNIRKPPFIKGLYLASHWSTLGCGIPGASYAGTTVAREIIKKLSIN
jgi:phytoene dehydrogenase-like protein